MERPEPSEAIHYKDIGRRFYIEGDFGKLYTDFKLRGIVLKPTGKGDTSGIARVDLTHIRGKEVEQRRIAEIVTNRQFEIGSEVELVVREEARLWYPETIDDVGSNPDSSHFYKLHCVVSLQLRQVVSLRLPAKNGTSTNPARGSAQNGEASQEGKKNSEQGGADQPATSPGSNSDGDDDPFRPKAPDSKWRKESEQGVPPNDR